MVNKKMDKLTLIFVGGDSRVDKLIEDVSGGDVSHVACLLFDSVYEATGMKEESDLYPGTWLHNPTKYDSNPDARFIEIEIPDMAALKGEARNLLGTPYAYGGCIKTGIYDLSGIELPDCALTTHCSETITRLLRSGGVNILPDIEPGCIDPSRLYKAVITWITT
jgi:hypothetical protein